MVELLVVIAIIGVLIALLLPAVQAAREAARRSQCINHLKQITLACHNFHDTIGGLPPTYIYLGTSTQANPPDGRLSLWGLIYPFIEQQSLYAEAISDGGISVSGTGYNRIFRKDWWDALGDDGKKAFGSVSIYKCPSRRSGVQFNDDVNLPGPLKDYTATALVLWESSTSTQWWHKQGRDSVHLNIGPFRHAITTGTVNSWKPRDTFAWWADGTSNQILFAESHVPVDHLGLCKEHNSSPNITRAQMGDCSYLSSRPEVNTSGGNYEWRPWTVMRSTLDSIPTSGTVSNGYAIAKEPNAYNSPTDSSWGTYSFGSYHPGVFNIALGDGSILSISNAINRPNLTRMIWVNDGVGIEFP